MNRRRVGVLVAVVMLLSGLAAHAQQGKCDRQVIVRGTADKEVVPDLADISIGTEIENPDAKQAMAANAVAIKKLIATAQQFGVKREDIQVNWVSLHRVEETDEVTKKKVATFDATQFLVITLRDIAQYDALLAALIENGANRIDSVWFRTSQEQQLRSEVRRLAIRAARTKADQLASEAGVKVVGVCQIDETSGEGGFTNIITKSGTNGEGDNAVSGKVLVSASLTASFEIQ